MQITVYKNTNKIHSYRVKRDAVNLDLSVLGVTKVEVVDQGASISSETSDVSFTGSQLNIRWDGLDLPPGTYSPTIYIYYDGAPQGEVLYGPGINPIELLILEDERPSKAKLSATTTKLSLKGKSKPISSIVVSGQTIDFGLYNNNLNLLSSYTLSVVGVAEDVAIAVPYKLPSKVTYTFNVSNDVSTKSYTKKWVI